MEERNEGIQTLQFLLLIFYVNFNFIQVKIIDQQMADQLVRKI